MLNKLFKIYFVRVLALLTSALSYIIVIPKISSNTSQYGIYTVLISLMIFLQYADLGFLGAGQRYATESFGSKNHKKEIEYLSFVHFILLLATTLYAISLIVFYFKPEIIFHNLSSIETKLVMKILLVFIIFSPLIVVQRYISAIFSIRIEDYIPQLVEITSNLFKIGSTFIFFSNTNYNLVDYVIFIQIMNLITALVCIVIANKRYNYNFKYAIQSFRFNKLLYNSTKKMAQVSIISTISWILYFELDAVYINKLYGTSIVALFAIANTLTSFVRNLMSSLFAPFQVRFNQLKGRNENVQLEELLKNLIKWAFPLTTLPVLVLILIMQPLILAWVGTKYVDSIPIAQFFVLSILFSFLATPLGYYFITKEKFKYIFYTSIILPILYFSIFLIFKSKFNYLALPIAKISTIFIEVVISVFLIQKIIFFNLINHLKELSLKILPSLAFIFIVYILSNKTLYSTTSNSHYILFILILSSILVILIALSLYYFQFKEIRERIKRFIYA